MSKITDEDWLNKGFTSKTKLITSKKKIAKSIVRVLNSQIEVLFPFQSPYECQVKMIEKVIECIE